MRILMVIHTPWTRNLGGPRVQLELGEELRALGCTVEKFSYEDAFPEPPARLRAGLLGRALDILRHNRSFAARAEAYLRENAGRFDIVDANQTDLTLPKRALGFSGLLVARSVGLIPAYAEFERWATGRWPEPLSLRLRAHRLLTAPAAWRRLRDVQPSFHHADLINVSNRDDLATLRSDPALADKTVLFPFGLSEERRQALGARRASPAERLRVRTVAFIGTWNSRKGSKDWPRIVSEVLARAPGTRFRFLGTGMLREHVLRDFAPDLASSIEVVPSYDSERLPELLADATVGAFPGYLEGFGFAVLEKLAAGLPTVTYDAPGARDTMKPIAAHEAMVPVGDIDAFAARLAEVLALSPEHYAERSTDALAAAAQLSWREIARDTLTTYVERLERLGR